MKRLFCSVLVSLLYSSGAFAQIKPGTIVIQREVSTKDSVEFYETDYEVRQKSYMNLLAGSWTITSMKRQAKMETENLSNVTLTINADSSFTGSAGCNTIWGKLSVKGTSVKFTNITSTRKSCENAELEVQLLKLLQQTVSAYSVTKNTLLLRDGASNVVFEGNRK